jgi:hypothetical protein
MAIFSGMVQSSFLSGSVQEAADSNCTAAARALKAQPGGRWRGLKPHPA